MKLWLLFVFCVCCLCARATWMDDQYLYWRTGGIYGVALTENKIHGIEHAVGAFTSVQIGDQNGPDASFCTAFVNCPTSIQNCEWLADHYNITNDRILFVTCRPLTNGITYIATNLVVGEALKWFSPLDMDWVDATLEFDFPEIVVTFPDASTAFIGSGIMLGRVGVEGESSAPVFRASNGDFVGSVTGPGVGEGRTVFKYAYPSGSQYRPATVSPPFSAVSVLFNRDPDE